MPNDFSIDTGDYLGIKYQSFKDDLLSLALAQPSEYFKLRKQVLKKVKQDALEQVFNLYYNLLTKGRNFDDSAPITAEFEDIFKPNYPKQLTAQFALGASKTIDKIVEDAIEILLPKDYKSLAQDRFVKKAEGNLSL